MSPDVRTILCPQRRQGGCRQRSVCERALRRPKPDRAYPLSRWGPWRSGRAAANRQHVGGPLSAGHGALAREVKAGTAHTVRHQRGGGKRGLLHPRQRRQPGAHSFVESADAISRVSAARRVEGEQQQVLRLEARVELQQMREAAHKQARRTQQQGTHRHLGHHQDAARPPRSAHRQAHSAAPDFRPGVRSPRIALRAGARPNSRAVSIVASAVNASVRASKLRSSSSGAFSLPQAHAGPGQRPRQQQPRKRRPGRPATGFPSATGAAAGRGHSRSTASPRSRGRAPSRAPAANWPDWHRRSAASLRPRRRGISSGVRARISSSGSPRPPSITTSRQGSPRPLAFFGYDSSSCRAACSSSGFAAASASAGWRRPNTCTPPARRVGLGQIRRPELLHPGHRQQEVHLRRTSRVRRSHAAARPPAFTRWPFSVRSRPTTPGSCPNRVSQ